jgi:hypothetical protein
LICKKTLFYPDFKNAMSTLSKTLCSVPDDQAIDQKQAVLDELTPIAQYMANQITFNALSKEVRLMRELNLFNTHQCLKNSAKLPWLIQLLGQDCLSQTITNHQTALLIWTLKVAQNSEWDHKPFIRSCFRPRSANTPTASAVTTTTSGRTFTTDSWVRHRASQMRCCWTVRV